MKDPTNNNSYKKGYKFGIWFFENQSIIYYAFCTLGTVISMFAGHVCATMVGCTLLICHHLRQMGNG